MTATRSKYQEGSLSRVARTKKPDVWVYRWRQLLADGSRVQRKRNIGSVLQFPTESSAKRAVENLRTEINEVEKRVGELRLRELWGHFQAHELRDPDVDRSPTTIEMYLSNFKLHILPRWGEMYLSEIKAVDVERWLRGMSLAPSTKAKLKHHLSCLFSHAIRHEMYNKLNPIASVRQGSKRVSIPDILTLPEMCRIVAGIKPMIVRTAVLVAAVTGLRRSEIRGLKWSDVDFEKLWLDLNRGRVRNLQTKLKTEASRRGVPISEELAATLTEWRKHSLYRADSDWVFASETVGGRKPIWLDIALENYVRPTAVDAGIGKKIGWHTFRRSLSSILEHKGESVKVVQELLRHANPSTTRDLYQQADVEAKRAAQSHVDGLFVLERRTA